MKKGNVLSKAEMKNVMGGFGPCTEPDLPSHICYNCCMAGYDEDEHTEEQNEDKVNFCEGKC